MSEQAASYDRSIFIQGLPRAGTTYVWSKFRKDSENTCYNEPLNPYLGSDEFGLHLAGKSLRHPSLDKPIFAEYKEKCAPIDLGIKRYYLPKDSEEPELEHYINQLEVTAGKRPVFKFVRLALRGEWLADKFPGNHIYISRDLSELVNSYYSFHGRFSWYLTELVAVVGTNAETEVFGEMANYMGLKKLDADYSTLHEYYRKIKLGKFKDDVYTRQTMVDMVAFFRELAQDQANHYANTVISYDDLSDPGKRKELEYRLNKLTGTTLDFSDFNSRKNRAIKEAFPSANVLTIIEAAKSAQRKRM